jgi:hypothetical protein
MEICLLLQIRFQKLFKSGRADSRGAGLHVSNSDKISACRKPFPNE